MPRIHPAREKRMYVRPSVELNRTEWIGPRQTEIWTKLSRVDRANEGISTNNKMKPEKSSN